MGSLSILFNFFNTFPFFSLSVSLFHRYSPFSRTFNSISPVSTTEWVGFWMKGLLELVDPALERGDTPCEWRPPLSTRNRCPSGLQLPLFDAELAFGVEGVSVSSGMFLEPAPPRPAPRVPVPLVPAPSTSSAP